MPDDFLDAKENRVSQTGLAYLSRLLPPSPDVFSPFL
jgi:hypothetical protein